MTTATLDIMRDGRISELDPNYVPDVTRTRNRIFDDIVHDIDDPKARDFFLEFKAAKEHDEMMEQVRRYLSSHVVDAAMDALEDTRADLIPALVVETTPPLEVPKTFDKEWQDASAEETSQFDRIWAEPDKRHLRRAFMQKVHRALRWLRSH